MAERQFKIVGKHLKDCFARKAELEGRWHTAWGPIAYGKHGAPVVTTERRYGKNGRAFKHWVRFICNCSGCPAELHVLDDFIIGTVRASAQSEGDKR